MTSRTLTTHPRSSHPAANGVQTRLPWWAVALPTLAFAALLMLVLAPGAPDQVAAEPVVRMLGRITQALPDLARYLL